MATTVKYDAKTGKKLKSGQSTTDALGNTYKQGQSYSAPSSGGGSKSSVPAYNSATGATTGAPSAEYDAYLKSLNKKGSANYIPTPEDMGGQVNTAQPNPATASKEATAGLPGSPTPDMVGFDAKTGQALAPGASTTDALGNTFTQGSKYSEALKKLQASGQLASQDAGTGKMMAAGMVDTPVQPVSPLGGIMETDTNFDSIFTNLDKYMEPLQQKKSLLQEYQGLSKSLGINSINEELIDAKKIIEGTEDDIRAEVTAAGGFATDSQVLALSNARNKSLIKNYNVLLESRDNAMTQLNTMMNLTMEDRKAAEAEFDRKMDFSFKIAEFKQKAKDNATSQFNKVVENVGYAGLLASTNGNAYEQSIIEKTLGLGVGGLAKLATTPGEKDLQFVSGTDNQPMGYFDKNTGKFTKLGGGGSGGGGTGLSSTTQAIINNPTLFDDLTSTERGKVIAQLQSNGYDTSNLGKKGLSDSAIQSVAQTQKALDDLAVLKSKIQGNEDKLGPITGLAALNPWSESRKIQADVDRVRQTVGKALEGGVLRKEDEDKYKKILSTLTDTPSTAYYKIDALIGSISRDIENYKSLQQSSGKSLDVGKSLQKAGTETKVEDLRSKYQY